MKAHVYVDLLEEKLSKKGQIGLKLGTRLIGILLFLFIGYNFILYGLSLKDSGEVSAGLKIPYYPITFGLAVSCFMESLTLFTDLLKLFQREAHE
jgi:TRAP-type C4-dicarboxylate transport system permease small subunit